MINFIGIMTVLTALTLAVYGAAILCLHPVDWDVLLMSALGVTIFGCVRMGMKAMKND